MSDTQTIIEAKESQSDYFLKSDIKKVNEAGGKGMPILKVYDPKRFWDDVGEDFYKAFNSQAQLQMNSLWMSDRLKQLGVATLLEVGCGFGRILPFLLESGAIKSAVGIDISDKIVANSKDYLNPTPSDTLKLDDYRKKLTESKIDSALKLKLEELLISQYAKRKQNPPDFRDKIEIKLGDARKLEFESDSFDCVLSSETMQHLSCEDVEDAVLEMVRVSRKVIFMVERWVFPGEHPQPDLWSHNYVDILNKLGVKVVQASLISNGLQGVIALKR